MAEARSLEELAERVERGGPVRVLAPRSVTLLAARTRARHRTLARQRRESWPRGGPLPGRRDVPGGGFPLLGLMVDEARPLADRGGRPDATPRSATCCCGSASSPRWPRRVLAGGRVWGELFATGGAGPPAFDDDDLGLRAGVRRHGRPPGSRRSSTSPPSSGSRTTTRSPAWATGGWSRTSSSGRWRRSRPAAGRPSPWSWRTSTGSSRRTTSHGHEAGDRALVSVGARAVRGRGRVPAPWRAGSAATSSARCCPGWASPSARRWPPRSCAAP